MADHFVSGSCGGEVCRCGNPATHKVGEEIAEDDPHYMRHNLTVYVCCECFSNLLGPATHCMDDTPSWLDEWRASFPQELVDPSLDCGHEGCNE